MGGTSGSLAAALSTADSLVTVLDDRIDAEDYAAFLWLNTHKRQLISSHPVVLGAELLRPAWRAKTKNFHDVYSAQTYLNGFAHDHGAMQQIQSVARSLNIAGPIPLSDHDAITIVADDLVDGRAWIIEFPSKRPKSRFITKTSPDAFASINPRLGTRVDFVFIASLEGNQWLRGYIPMSQGGVIANSDMTVATGFDLGQWGVSELQGLGSISNF